MAKHRFLQTVDGRTHFARVEVVVVDSNDSSGAIASDLRKSVAPEWVSAAEEGLDEARRRAESSSRLTVAGIHGSVVDTRADTVRVAACLAALEALGIPSAELPRPELVDGEWRVGSRPE